MNKTTPTIADIASEVGVSTATVSRALNDTGQISEGIRSRVIDAAERLGYNPQRLHKKKSSTEGIAVLTENLTVSFFNEVIAGVVDQAEDQGIITSVFVTGEDPKRKRKVLQQIKQYEWMGIISAGVYITPNEWIKYQAEVDVALVVMNTAINHPKIASVMVNFGATETAVQHLLDLNHTRIAYLGDLDNTFSAQEFACIEKALATRGFTYPDEYRFSIPHTPEGASLGISRMMMMPQEKRPTAYITFDDDLAIDVFNILRYYGLRIPEDISIVGFDNIPMAAHTYPPLTTIDVPKRRVGMQMVLLISKLIKNGEQSSLGHTIVDASLIVRGSTGPCPSK